MFPQDQDGCFVLGKLCGQEVNSNLEFRISDFVNRSSYNLHTNLRLQDDDKGDLTMDKHELEQRTKRFALRIIAFVASLPRGRIGDVVGFQLLKAGTSVGANYREANRAESKNDFIHKIAIVEKEASESHYWLELIHESNLGELTERLWLLNEAGELLAIFTSTGKTSKVNRQKQ